MADSDTTLPDPPRIPSGKEIYDMLMKEIEPELISDVIPTLKEKYKNETEEEKNIRRERYKTAFKKYQERYNLYMTNLKNQVHHYYKESMKTIETMATKNENTDLESMFDAM